MTPDPVDIVALTRALVDIDSTTGREGEAGAWLASYLRGRGFTVIEQPVDAARFNVIATPQGPPQLVFSTHFDCVPPFFASRVDGDRIHGRGSCDAKGILAAQVAAADRLMRDGETRVGLVFVVGEERGSDGARRANEAATGGCRFLIDGEPTDNRLGLATRGILRLKLRATGRAAHSSFPELGESAIDKLIDALIELRSIELPGDPVLGRTHYTVGLIDGGVAPNVVPPSADAEVMFRTVSDAARRAPRRGVARTARDDRARARGASGAVDDHPGVRRRRISLHHGHSVPGPLGRSAAVRSRIHSRRAYRGRVRRDCGADRSGGSLRQDCPTPPRRPALSTSAA